MISRLLSDCFGADFVSFWMKFTVAVNFLLLGLKCLKFNCLMSKAPVSTPVDGQDDDVAIFRLCCLICSLSRLRVVSNFGDGDCGAGEIHTRARKFEETQREGSAARVCISSAPQSPSPKLETTRSLFFQLSYCFTGLIELKDVNSFSVWLCLPRIRNTARIVSGRKHQHTDIIFKLKNSW